MANSDFKSVNDLFGKVTPDTPYVRIDNVLNDHFDVIDKITLDLWAGRGVYLWAASSEDPEHPHRIDTVNQLLKYSKEFGDFLMLYLVDSNYMDRALEIANELVENDTSTGRPNDSEDLNDDTTVTPWHSPRHVRKYS